MSQKATYAILDPYQTMERLLKMMSLHPIVLTSKLKQNILLIHGIRHSNQLLKLKKSKSLSKYLLVVLEVSMTLLFPKMKCRSLQCSGKSLVTPILESK